MGEGDGGVVEFAEVFAPEDLVEGELAAAVGVPVGAYEDLGGVDDSTGEQGAEGGVDFVDDLPDVGEVELAATVGAAGAVDGSGEEAVEVFDAAGEEGAAMEKGPFAGAERDAAIDFAE